MAPAGGAGKPTGGAAREPAQQSGGLVAAGAGLPGLQAAQYQDSGSVAWDRTPGIAGGEPVLSRPQITARSAILAMFALFLAGNLVSDWLHIGVLTGLAVLVGWLAAGWYTNRRQLLMIIATPPTIFLIAVVAAQVITVQGSTLLASTEFVLAGTFLTLADTAPWLFAAAFATVAVTMFRGLPRCARELRSQLRGDQVSPHRGAGNQMRRAAS